MKKTRKRRLLIDMEERQLVLISAIIKKPEDYRTELKEESSNG